MRILVVDKFFQPRDPAQTDIYKLVAKHHKVVFASDPINALIQGKFDILWLGIYHHRMNLDLHQIFHFTRNKLVLIDQADNEEFLESKLAYNCRNKIVLSRYLPHERLRKYCKRTGAKLRLLPWFVDPSRFHSQEKKIDVAFICSIHGKREELAENVKSICKNELSYIIGEYWGEDYINALARSRVLVVECSRECLTQKYIEGALSRCELVGDKPEYPENSFIVNPTFTELYGYNHDAIEHNYNLAMDTYANEAWFMERFNSIIS